MWLLLIECMDLHFDYHVSDQFCGIANNIVLAPSELEPSTHIIILKTLLHILPLFYILMVMFWKDKWALRINLGLSAVYLLFHAGHFVSQLSQEPFLPLQMLLLTAAFIIAMLLVVISYTAVQDDSAE